MKIPMKIMFKMSVTWLKGLRYLVCCLPPIECFFVFPFMHASRHDGVSVYLAKPIKQHVEVGQHCSPGNLHYIVKGLTGVVAQTAVRIIETGKNRINEFFKVQSRILNSTKDKKHNQSLHICFGISSILNILQPIYHWIKYSMEYWGSM